MPQTHKTKPRFNGVLTAKACSRNKVIATLQVAFDAGAKRILLPMSSVGDIAIVPGELFAKFQTSF